MPHKSSRGSARERLQPLSVREIELRIGELVDALARAAEGAGDARPALLAPAEVLRCLAPLVGRN